MCGSLVLVSLAPEIHSATKIIIAMDTTVNFCFFPIGVPHNLRAGNFSFGAAMHAVQSSGP